MAAQGVASVLIKAIAFPALLNIFVLGINDLDDATKVTKKCRDFRCEVKQYLIRTLKVFHTQRNRAIIERVRCDLVGDKTYVSGCPECFIQLFQFGFAVTVNVEAMAVTVELLYQTSREGGAFIVARLIENIEVNLSQITPVAIAAE